MSRTVVELYCMQLAVLPSTLAVSCRLFGPWAVCLFRITKPNQTVLIFNPLKCPPPFFVAFFLLTHCPDSGVSPSGAGAGAGAGAGWA